MPIREISNAECLRLLTGTRRVRLACARDNQPYIVPVYLAYDHRAGCLYGFTTPGQKVDWMRANPKVCVEADAVVAPDQWVSIVVFGRYEELPEIPGRDEARGRAHEHDHRNDRIESAWPTGDRCRGDEGFDNERDRAYRLLSTDPAWGAPASAAWADRLDRDPALPFITVYYKIWIDRVTGHEAIPHVPIHNAGVVPAIKKARLRRALARVLGRTPKGTSLPL